jgi:hypothetical protein
MGKLLPSGYGTEIGTHDSGWSGHFHDLRPVRTRSKQVVGNGSTAKGLPIDTYRGISGRRIHGLATRPMR